MFKSAISKISAMIGLRLAVKAVKVKVKEDETKEEIQETEEETKKRRAKSLELLASGKIGLFEAIRISGSIVDDDMLKLVPKDSLEEHLLSVFYGYYGYKNITDVKIAILILEKNKDKCFDNIGIGSTCKAYLKSRLRELQDCEFYSDLISKVRARSRFPFPFF